MTLYRRVLWRQKEWEQALGRQRVRGRSWGVRELGTGAGAAEVWGQALGAADGLGRGAGGGRGLGRGAGGRQMGALALRLREEPQPADDVPQR